MYKVLFLLFVMLMVPLKAKGEESLSSDQRKTNPHNGKARCEICHVATEEDLNSWFTFSSTKRRLRLDYNEVCWQCHDVEFGHGVGKITKINRDNLPMDSEGRIACAITCHNLHIKAADPQQDKFHLRAPHMKLCLSCHDR